MLPKLEETIYADFITSSPTTAAAADADSLPTCEVFEDATDTAILSPTVTKRTSKTGNYRVPIACTAANGFEAGKSYNVVASATVGGVAAKAVVLTFQVRARMIDDASTYSGGAVASVTGAVGSVTGAVGSVTGNVGGNVVGNVNGTVASVVGNVGGNVNGTVASVTGNVNGNVSGSVGSVTGAVGSVTGAVGSVTGNVGGNVVGSVASVAGAVGSVTGNVGGDVVGKVLGGGAGTITGDGVRASSVTGAVGSVTGAVGSVTGAVGSVTGNVGGNLVGTIGDTRLDTILGRIGSFAGTGVNTILGMFKALLSKTATTPSDVGGTFDPATDSTEAIRDQGDTAWLTGGGGGGGTTDWTEEERANIRHVLNIDGNKTPPTDWTLEAGTLQGHIISFKAELYGTPAVNLNLAAEVPATGHEPNSIGDCLNGARAQAFGRWVLNDEVVPPTLTIYGPNNEELRVFTLDSATSPLSRT